MTRVQRRAVFLLSSSSPHAREQTKQSNPDKNQGSGTGLGVGGNVVFSNVAVHYEHRRIGAAAQVVRPAAEGMVAFR
jgi:hypothetical protein